MGTAKTGKIDTYHFFPAFIISVASVWHLINFHAKLSQPETFLISPQRPAEKSGPELFLRLHRFAKNSDVGVCFLFLRMSKQSL